MQGVKASWIPKPKKVASTTQKLAYSNIALMSVSLAKIENPGDESTEGGLLVMEGTAEAPGEEMTTAQEVVTGAAAALSRRKAAGDGSSRR